MTSNMFNFTYIDSEKQYNNLYTIKWIPLSEDVELIVYMSMSQ